MILDYFQFSFKSETRNYIYSDLFDKAYSQDFDSSPLLLKLDYHIGNMNPKMFWALNTSLKPPFLKENGQYLYYGLVNANDFRKREISRMEI